MTSFSANTSRLPSALSLGVFCGSRHGSDPAYRAAAAQLGTALGQNGIRLVYGGGQVGLMGVVADATLEAGGQVLGIIPGFLQRREVAHQGPIAMVVTDNMHDRKRQMFEASDAFAVMPGGLGTFDEAIEITTWRQLGLHDKPIYICNVAGWAAAYIAAIDTAIAQGFAPTSSRNLFEVLPDVPTLMARLAVLTPAQRGQPERV